MAIASRRRRRRPRWLLIAAVVTAVVLAVNTAVSARSKGPSRRLAELAYLDEVRPQVERSTAEGADIEQVRAGAAKLGRPAIDRCLGQVAAEAMSALRAVRAAEPPRSLTTAHELLVATMAVRARAAASVREAFTAALGTGPPEPSVEALAGAGLDMAAADRTYAVFLASLPPGARGSAGAMPPSVWAADPESWSRGAVGALVSAMRASATLAPVHDVSVVLVTTDPAAVGRDGAASVLPVTASMRLQVVVADSGNEGERRAPVTATLAIEGAPPTTAREFVDLTPGQRMTVNLVGLKPAPGAGTLTVTVGPVGGETATADNTVQSALLFR